MPASYIGADVDSKTIEIAVEQRKEIVARHRVPTSIASVVAVLDNIGGTKHMAIEEGPLAHWLFRNLDEHVNRLVVCDSRRNAYIAKDGDKDDPIDAGKLAELLRGRFIREVYHSRDDCRVELKRWVGLYHDRVRQVVREINKLRGCCRHYGVRPPARILRPGQARSKWMGDLSDPGLADQLEVLWPSLDVIRQQVTDCRRQLSRRVGAYPIIARWCQIPGVGLVRAATLLAYLDTPWRFASKNKLAKYCGVGLARFSSGKDRFGKPKTGRLQLAWQVNKRLKDAVIGATISAINHGRNPFARRHGELIQKGMSRSNARHTIARRLLTVMWGMWKTEQPYDPALV